VADRTSAWTLAWPKVALATLILLMNAKPQLRESLGIVGTFVVLGLVAAVLIPARRSALSAANSDARS
jgi:hypothetical protein